MPPKPLASHEDATALYDSIYDQGSSRLANEGLVGIRYRLPKCVSLLRERYADCEPLEVLEIGAGVGEVAEMVMGSGIPIKRYVGIEYSSSAARGLGARGMAAARMDAEALGFRDDSFDLVFCFDVMHHVDDPSRMAREILRVTRRHFLLSESNGLSPVRKLGERSALARALGERSYFPWTYRSFFPSEHVASIEVRPFYVLVPPHTPERYIPLVRRISEMGERVPGLRWIGQSVLITGEKKAAKAVRTDVERSSPAP